MEVQISIKTPSKPRKMVDHKLVGPSTKTFAVGLN